MGVPGFYRWITQRYPLIRRRMNDVARPRIDNFYVDFNCIIYNALRLVDTSVSMDQLFDETCRYLDLLVQIIQPQSVLFIAVDGPAPFAKCSQQRSRRFVAARDRRPGGFDSTSISVGTEFMESLHQVLLSYFEEKTKTDQTWKKPQLIYSSHRVPGEGEHKFFNYFREQRKSARWNPNATHCVYSPDADLIFLCLQTREKYFYIMREWECWIGPHENVGNGKLNKLRASESDFELLHLTLIRDYLLLDFEGTKDVNRLIDDFAAFSYFIGNDFIPHFPDVNIQSFEEVVNAYQASVLAKNQYIIENGAFNKPVFKNLLLEIIKRFSCSKQNNNNKQKQKNAFDFTVNPEQKSLEYLKLKYPEEMDQDPEEFQKKLCFAVLDSFEWVLQYYTKGCPSWTWCYQYFYAPPLVTIAKFCEQHISSFTLDRPPFPFEQLLCILPPQSSNLLPEPIGNLMKDPRLVEFYPETFEIDLNGRRFEHEGVVLIPIVDVDMVREIADELFPTLTPAQQTRNTLQKDVVFSFGKFHEFDINNDLPPHGNDVDPPPGYSTLISPHFPISVFKESNKVKIFIFASANDSIIIHNDINRYSKPIVSRAADLKSLIGTILLVDWPFLRPALVKGVCDNDKSFMYDDKSKSIVDSGNFPLQDVKYQYMTKYGIDLEGTQILLAVNVLDLSNINETRYTFSHSVSYVPYQYTLSSQMSNSIQRFATHPEPPPTLGSRCVICDGQFKGQLGIIIDIQNDMLKVKVTPRQLTSLTNIIESDKKEWLPFDVIVKDLRIDSETLMKAFRDLPLDRDTNVSLTLMHTNRVLDGYCRKSNRGYLFAKDVIPICIEWLDKAGGLKEILRDAMQSDDKIKLTEKDLWGNDTHKKTEFLNWAQKESPLAKHFLIDDKDLVVSQSVSSQIESALIKNRPMELPPVEIEISKQQAIWQGKQRTFPQVAKIGSRIIGIPACGSFPFGETGVIVGMNNISREIQIIADKESRYLTNLRKRLSTKRGFIIKYDDTYIIE